jgi:hypothetical protein
VRVGTVIGAGLALNLASCVWLLDFDELEEGDGGVAAGTPIPLSDAASTLAAASCARLQRCLGPALVLAVGDAECIDVYSKIYDNALFDDVETLTEDRFEYHPTLLAACAAAIENRECGAVGGHDAECEAALEGKVGQGSECLHPLECSTGLFCDGSSGCPGTCLPELGEGQPCRGRECAANLECVTLGGTQVCSPVVNVEGGACDNGEPPCALSKLCLGKQDSMPGTCQSVTGVFIANQGNVCNVRQGPFCNEGLHCEFDTMQAFFTTGAGQCVPPSNAGGPCKLAIPDPCPKNYFCLPNAATSPEGVCTKSPITTETCAPDLTTVKSRCAVGATCVEATNLCQPITDNGASCSGDTTCYSKYCSGNVCSPLACNQ